MGKLLSVKKNKRSVSRGESKNTSSPSQTETPFSVLLTLMNLKTCRIVMSKLVDSSFTFVMSLLKTRTSVIIGTVCVYGFVDEAIRWIAKPIVYATPNTIDTPTDQIKVYVEPSKFFTTKETTVLSAVRYKKPDPAPRENHLVVTTGSFYRLPRVRWPNRLERKDGKLELVYTEYTPPYGFQFYHRQKLYLKE